MDHSQFKANQTAAVYVADGLDASTQEAFEMHMMGCQECVEDVETWRAVKVNIPARVRPIAARRFRTAATWQMAATLLVGGVLGASGGWFGRAAQGPNLDSGHIVFFNMPAVNRGGDDCTALRLTSDSQLAVLRIPGIAVDRRLLAVDSEKQELLEGTYTVRLQPDGSRLMQLPARAIVGRAVHLQTRGADGENEPLGCITGATDQ